MARVAMTDIEAVKTADHAGRLYVPTRSLPADENVPRPFAPAPTARYRALQDAYQAALDASKQAAQVLDTLTVATRASSMPLALARTAASVQSHRRTRLDNDDLDDVLRADTTPLMNSHGSTGQAGPLEQALIDRRVSDPALLLRASAIDNAARRLLTQAQCIMSELGEIDERENRQLPAHCAAELAAQDFPQSPHAALSADIRPLRPGSPAVPAPRTDQSSRGLLAAASNRGRS